MLNAILLANQADKIEFYQRILENQQNYYNSTLTTIAIISGVIIALITIWGFVASKQQIAFIAKKMIEKELRKNEQLNNARTYLIFSDIFYKNKQYEISVSLQLLSLVLFLKCGEIKEANKAINPIEQRPLVGLDFEKVKKYLNYFEYDYKDLSNDLSKYDKNGIVISKVSGILEIVIEKLK